MLESVIMKVAAPCVLFFGCSEEDALIIPHDYAPFIDEEEGRLKAELVALSNELSESKAKIKRLEKEAEELEQEAREKEQASAPSLETKSAEKQEEAKEEAPAPSAIDVEATAYTAFCEGCSGITATGVDVRNTIYHEGKRIIATDPNVIPLHSIVKVTLGDGSSFEAVAKDTGGAIKGARIDILYEPQEEALSFGRQSAKVEIIK